MTITTEEFKKKSDEYLANIKGCSRTQKRLMGEVQRPFLIVLNEELDALDATSKLSPAVAAIKAEELGNSLVNMLASLILGIMRVSGGSPETLDVYLNCWLDPAVRRLYAAMEQMDAEDERKNDQTKSPG